METQKNNTDRLEVGAFLLVALALLFGMYRIVNPTTIIQAEATGSDVLSPKSNFDLPSGANAFGVSSDGEYAYIVTASNGSEEFYIIDPFTTEESNLVGAIEIGANVNAVSVNGNYAYLATSHNQQELVVVDISNKSNPVITDVLDIQGQQNAFAVEAGENSQVYVGTAKYGGGAELFVFDASSAENVVLLGDYEVGAKVTDITHTGSNVYITTTSGSKEVIKLDASDPTAITIVASFNTPNTAQANGIAVDGNILYLALNNGSGNSDFYTLFDSGSSLTELDSIDLRSNNLSVATAQGRAYVTTNDGQEGITVVNIADPQDITVSSTYSVGAAAYDLVVSDYYLYVATAQNQSELQVVNPHLILEALAIQDIDGDGVWRVGCLGDSNTVTLNFFPKKWCEHFSDLVDDPRLEVINVSHAGATVTVQQNNPAWEDAYLHVDLALQNDLDALMLAYGTNDHFQGRSPQEVIDAYLLHEQTALAAGVTQYYVATTPDILDRHPPNILAMNDLIRTTFGGRFIEFYDGFILEEHFNPDGYHFNNSGQMLRGQRAFEALQTE